MDIGLIVSFAGVTVATLAGVLGVWMERDPDSPRMWGFIFSAFILASSGVELVNTVDSTAESSKTEAKMATVLLAMSELAAKGDNPALEQFVGAELAVQARANPQVVKKMERDITAKGGDATTVTRRASEGRRLASGLPADRPATGERARLARPGEAGASRTKAGRTDAATGARTSGPRAPGERTGAATNLPGDAGKAVGKASKATEQAGAATARAGKAADSTAKAVSSATGGAVDTTKQVGAATSAARGATDSAAKATDSAAKATDSATKAADDAKKKADEAKKKADEAKKKADEAKKKADDKAKDALKGIGS